MVDGRSWWRHERCTCWPLPEQGQLIVLLRSETEVAP
jgi:hypothetical protein